MAEARDLAELRRAAAEDGATDTGAYVEWLERLALRYERGLVAIASSGLIGVDFGDWVQAVCEDMLDGQEVECPECDTAAHDGPCVGEGV